MEKLVYIDGNDVEQPEPRIDERRLMSLSRLSILFFLFLLFSQGVAAITILYPSLPNTTLSCYFIKNNKLIYPPELKLGENVYILCILSHFNDIKIFINYIKIMNDTLNINVPNFSDFYCFNISKDGIDETRFLIISSIKFNNFAIPLDLKVSKICYYKYNNNFLDLYLIKIKENGYLIVEDLKNNYKEKQYELSFLKNSIYYIIISHVFMKEKLYLSLDRPLKIVLKSNTIPENILLSINGTVPLPLQYYIGSNALRIIRFYLYAPAIIRIKNYKLIMNLNQFELYLPESIHEIEVNNGYIEIQKNKCSVFVYSELPLHDCSNFSYYRVFVTNPKYLAHYVIFNVSISGFFSPLFNVKIIVERNHKLYLKIYRNLIVNEVFTIPVIIPYDGSGENNITIKVIPENLNPQILNFKVYVPSPTPQVKSEIKVVKVYLKSLFLIWFIVTLILFVILIQTKPRFKI